MLADCRDRLLSSSFRLILGSSVSLSAGIQSAGDLVPETLVQILHLAEEDNLSPFNLKIACLCQSIEINNKQYVQCTPDISQSCISRNWICRGRMLDPIFLRPRARYFSRNRSNSLGPISGRLFLRNLLTAIAFVLGSQVTIFREINSKPA